MKKLLSSLMALAITLAISCNTDHRVPNPNSAETSTYTSEVALKWMDMQLRLFRTNPTFIGGFPPHRFMGYTAIALYESVVQGMPAYQTLAGQLTNIPPCRKFPLRIPITGLPVPMQHWPP
ncbi:hypothetical protein [Spirosoma areae]